jgi:hypothetical protein
MIGHHFSASAFTSAPSASGVCWSRGKISNLSLLRVADRSNQGTMLRGVRGRAQTSLPSPLIDHLVGSRQQRFREGKAHALRRYLAELELRPREYTGAG